MIKTDVLIIGAGAVGAAIARELSKYKLKILVAEKSSDVGGDASKSNSAIIHTGYDAAPETLESRMVVSANPMFDQLARELDIPFSRVGAILPAFTAEQFGQLPALRHKAFLNHVYDVEYRSARQLLEMEPNLNPAVLGGLYIPRESIIDPFVFVVALCENACENGADFLLGARVTGMRAQGDKIRCVQTTGGEIEARYVVNAAGLYCDEIAAMAGVADYAVRPRRGEFYILDKNTPVTVRHIILPIPTKVTKGKLVAPTIHGNTLVGPTAEDLDDKLDHATTAAGLESVAREARALVPDLDLRDTITQFAGLRPNRNPEGLHVDRYDRPSNYINLSGVRSTGLTASVALGKYVAQMLSDMGLPLQFNEEFKRERRGIPSFREMDGAERARMIERDARYGNVVCRCEQVTEGEIVEAVHRVIPARTVDAVKRRLRAGMGRCQGGFCAPRVLEILSRELGVPAREILKGPEGSWMVTGSVKQEETWRG